MERILRPTVVGPAQIAVVTRMSGIEAIPGGLGRNGEGEGVGAMGRATGVYGSLLALGLTAVEHLTRQQLALLQSDAVIVET